MVKSRTHRTCLTIPLFVCGVQLLNPPTMAQTLSVGDRVRVTDSSTGKKTRGILERLEYGMLWVVADEEPLWKRQPSESQVDPEIPMRFRLSETVVERSVGNQGHWIVGATVGGIIGGVLGQGVSSAGPGDDRFWVMRDDFGFVIAWATVGAGIGAAIGHYTRTERWETVSAGEMSIEVTPNHHGAGAFLTIKF